MWKTSPLHERAHFEKNGRAVCGTMWLGGAPVQGYEKPCIQCKRIVEGVSDPRKQHWGRGCGRKKYARGPRYDLTPFEESFCRARSIGRTLEQAWHDAAAATRWAKGRRAVRACGLYGKQLAIQLERKTQVRKRIEALRRLLASEPEPSRADSGQAA